MAKKVTKTEASSEDNANPVVKVARVKKNLNELVFSDPTKFEKMEVPFRFRTDPALPPKRLRRFRVILKFPPNAPPQGVTVYCFAETNSEASYNALRFCGGDAESYDKGKKGVKVRGLPRVMEEKAFLSVEEKKQLIAELQEDVRGKKSR